MNPPTPPTGAAWSSPVREDQVVQAVRFLTDPRTAASSQSDREAFLRQKGLSDAEIAAAISRTNPSVVSAYSSPVYIPAPSSEEPIVWSALKSIFSAIGAVAIGVVGYHMYSAKELPAATPKSYFPLEESAEQTRSYERLSTAINELSSLQELRHKELLLSIRSSSGEVNRKVAGSVQLPASPVVQVEQPQPTPVDIDCNVTEQVARLIEQGLDSVVQLILSSKNRKLNASNPKFIPLISQFPALLSHCGFVQEENFWVHHGSDETHPEVIEEIKLQRKLVV